jgi:hypothetical protein
MADESKSEWDGAKLILLKVGAQGNSRKAVLKRKFQGCLPTSFI